MTDPRLDTTFARYRIEARLGQGGMGVVYRAVDIRLERTVALKVLAPDRAADPAFRERFLREGRLLASIEHPHIVTVYEADEWEDQLYLAMQYVRGPELGALIARDGALAPDQAVELVAQIADALDAAHAAGLVHRDVKPANILVVPGPDTSSVGHAYLTDFGLTKPAGEAASGLTLAGQFVGTPGYVAPEQIEGKTPLDHRADIYALGCVLYNCLTGTIPYPRDSTMAILWAHVWEPPPRPSELRPELAPFDAVLATAMAKAPADRYQTAGAFAAALRRALGALDPGVSRVGGGGGGEETTTSGATQIDVLRELETEARKTEVKKETKVKDPEPVHSATWTAPRIVAAIAVGAVLILGSALVLGGFGRPAASAGPTGSNVAAATARPTSSPTVGPTPTSTPTPNPALTLTLAQAQATLLAMIPEDIRSLCVAVPTRNTAIAQFFCLLEDTDTSISYQLHVAPWSVKVAYESERNSANVPVDSGDCERGDIGEGPWASSDGTSGGRVLCAPFAPWISQDLRQVIIWTDEETNTMMEYMDNGLGGNPPKASLDEMYATVASKRFDPISP